MIDDIGGITSQLVKLALDASVMRHQVLAGNIANANSKAYAAKRLDFQQILAQAGIDANSIENDSGKRDLLEVIKQNLSNSVIEEGSEKGVQLDMEMAKIAENTLRYQALLSGLSKRGSIIKMAISGRGDV